MSRRHVPLHVIKRGTIIILCQPCGVRLGEVGRDHPCLGPSKCAQPDCTICGAFNAHAVEAMTSELAERWAAR